MHCFQYCPGLIDEKRMIPFKTLTGNWPADANETWWQNGDNDDNADDVDSGVGASSDDDDDDVDVVDDEGDDDDVNDDDSDDGGDFCKMSMFMMTMIMIG